MQRIVVAAKAGVDEPWVADAAADIAAQTGAAVSVVSVDGLEMEGLSPMPRSEFTVLARKSVDGMLERLPPAASRPRVRCAPARSCPGSSSSPRSTTPI